MARTDPYQTFRFRIEIDGIERGGFQGVSGLERSTEVLAHREGGVNDYEHQLVVKTTYPAVVLKRGLADTYLWEWHQDLINGQVQRRTVSIALMGGSGIEVWRWICANSYPAKWGGADLDATSDSVLVESLELVHHGLTRQGK